MENNRTRDVIDSFVDKRPQSLGVYGYGSGVFKQFGYGGKVTPQIDIIFLVDNIKEWHQENLSMNHSDYSLIGRIHINTDNIAKLKGYNGITYYSNIYEQGFRFKYGVMEESDFITNLYTWQNFFIAGRFHKPIYAIKSNEEETEAINYNKKQAMLVAALLAPAIITKKAFYRVICGLSYAGTLRMYIAENPHKVNNIVEGSLEMFNLLYHFGEDYIEEKRGMVYINHHNALKHVKELPLSLVAFLYEYGFDFTDLDSVRDGITVFLNEHNRKEELHQSFEGIKTNGVVRSVPYLLAKIKKRIIK